MLCLHPAIGMQTLQANSELQLRSPSMQPLQLVALLELAVCSRMS
jgi:hypothetical protein